MFTINLEDGREAPSKASIINIAIAGRMAGPNWLNIWKESMGTLGVT